MEILDHGYLKIVETWGSDRSIIEAARMSTDKGFLGWGTKVTGVPCLPNGNPSGAPRSELPSFLVEVWEKNGSPDYQDATNPWREVRRESGDEKLLRYLYENKHATPFEMAGMIVEVKAPIFVFREWHRHRTQSYNEMSARYTPLPDENYVPSVERLMLNSKTNKQAGTIKGAKDLSEQDATYFQTALREEYASDQSLYEWALSAGVPKELARIHLPVGRYSKMRASANLRNWLAFLTLRMDEKAQWEIRQYANAVGRLIAESFPRTYELFLNEAIRGQ